MKQAGLLARNEGFWRYLSVAHEHRVGSKEDCVDAIHILCDVESRSEFVAGSGAASRWVNLVREFRAWEDAERRIGADA